MSTKAIPVIDIFTKPGDDTSQAAVTAQTMDAVQSALENNLNSGTAPLNDCKCEIAAWKNNDVSTGQAVIKEYSGNISNIVAAAGADLGTLLTVVYGGGIVDPDRITIIFVFVVEE